MGINQPEPVGTEELDFAEVLAIIHGLIDQAVVFRLYGRRMSSHACMSGELSLVCELPAPGRALIFAVGDGAFGLSPRRIASAWRSRQPGVALEVEFDDGTLVTLGAVGQGALIPAGRC